MYTLLKPLFVREELLKRHVRIFRLSVFTRIFKLPQYKAKYFLETQVESGLFLRLKKGLYALKTDLPSEEEIANGLYKPSYLSFEYGLAYYHMIPEMPHTVTSATTKPTRLFSVSNMSFSYRSIKKQAFTGYSLFKLENKSFLIADKEKVLMDYLYFIALQKISGRDRLLLSLKNKAYCRTQGLNKEKIKNYLALFRNKKLKVLVKPFI